MWFERNYLRDLEKLQLVVDDFLKEKEEEYRMGTIPVNIYENKDKVFAVLPIAGIPKENIEINYQNKNLSIRAKKEDDIKDIQRFLRKERKTGDFVRNIELTQVIDPESITAKYQNGFLVVELSKKEEAKTKKVTIN